jgi:hypothetical protein
VYPGIKKGGEEAMGARWLDDEGLAEDEYYGYGLPIFSDDDEDGE